MVALQQNMNHRITPEFGQIFRSAITSAGYRLRVVELGLDKDLDDLALDNRPSSSADLLLGLEDVIQRELAIDSGAHWAQFLRGIWDHTREAVQQITQQVETTPLSLSAGADAVRIGFVAPMLSELIRFAVYHFPGIDIDIWWRSPMAAWTELVASATGTSTKEINARLHETPRTTERWMAGKPVGDLQFPHRQTVTRCIASHVDILSSEQVDLLTGWLALAVGFQALPATLREEAQRSFAINPQKPWSLKSFIAELQLKSHDSGPVALWAQTEPLAAQIEHELTLEHPDLDLIERRLSEYLGLLSEEYACGGCSYQYIHDGFAARLKAIRMLPMEAIKHYEAAVEAMWWRGGCNQQPILNEALIYSVGVGDLAAAKRFWDKTFMLGVNRWPKRPLDEQERRRLAFAFERVFAPQLAKDRIPPHVEIVLRETPFELTAQQLRNPNAKVKHAKGRTRRTPLMNAVREGTLQDVERAVAAGGDPNDFIKESGEGPLSYAMRRACDQRDPLVMEYFLKMALSHETVNRQVSTSRETPLKIAIEMADAAAVERLVQLGADVEHACDYVPSALVYAMTLLHGSIHRADKTQEQAYLTGRTRADAHDAKDGFVLDMALASRRTALALMRKSSPVYEQLFRAVMDWSIRPPQICRQVVKTLLRLKADPNRRYKVDRRHLAEWTPTLLGAEIGDLEVFQALLEHGGNPDLVLLQSSPLDRQDAMWVAVSHDRHAIVNYLIKRGTALRGS